MRAGLLEQRILIEKKVTVGRTAHGALDERWRTVDTVYADVNFGADGSSSGTEVEDADRVVGLLQARFQIRYRSDITGGSSLRVRYDGRVYNITNVTEGVGRRERLTLSGYAENV